ncbi:MAG: hypothetical protein WD361_03765 [Gracilimonas sp.]
MIKNEPPKGIASRKKIKAVEKRAKAVGTPLKEINAPSRSEIAAMLISGMISFLTLHAGIFLTLFFLRPKE